MVVFMIKWALASIPAMLILGAIGGLVALIFGGFLGGLLAFFLGALILLIAVMDRPYRSREVGVAPKALQFVQQVMTADTGDGSGQVAGEEDD